jgi:hypothetical protein
VGRSTSQVGETIPEKEIKSKRTRGMAQVIEHFASIRPLSSIPELEKEKEIAVWDKGSFIIIHYFLYNIIYFYS